ncbi:hypothetical protein YC2023_018162 [Brassica napus]
MQYLRRNSQTHISYSLSHLCTTRNFLFNKHIRPIPENNPKPNPENHDHLSDTPKHPLDPLTLVEIQKVRSTLSSHALFASRAPHALHSVVLEEPDKNLVRQWEKGNALPPRKASVIARVVSDSHVLTVDLSTGHVDIVDSPVRVLGFPRRHMGTFLKHGVQPYDHLTWT